MLNYFIEKEHHQNDENGQPLTFYIELCMKSMGVGLDIALQKDNLFADPRFHYFFLKDIIIVHEIKLNSLVL